MNTTRHSTAPGQLALAERKVSQTIALLAKAIAANDTHAIACHTSTLASDRARLTAISAA